MELQIHKQRALQRGQTMRLVLSWLLFVLFLETFASRQMGNSVLGADYRSFYAAGYLARTAPGSLYDLARQTQVQSALISPGIALPFFHPAYEALLYAPLSLLQYRASYKVFLIFNAGLLLLILRTLTELSTARGDFLRRHPGLILFAYIPVVMALLQGQDSVLFLLLCCVAWRLVNNDADLAAGCVLGLCLFRFQLVLPLVFVLALRRGWPLLAGFLLSGAGVTSISVVMVGRAGNSALFTLLSSGSLIQNKSLAVQQAMAIHPLAMPNLFGLLYAAGSASLASREATGLVLLVSATMLGMGTWLSQRLTRTSDVFAVAVLCSILLSYHLYLHDLTLLIVPFALLQSRASFYLGTLVYALSAVLFFYIGASWYFVLAVPVLLLLMSALQPEYDKVGGAPVVPSLLVRGKFNHGKECEPRPT